MKGCPMVAERIIIHHADLSGVSPAMLDWWYHKAKWNMRARAERFLRALYDLIVRESFEIAA
jgi:hypothetical protein